MAVSAKFAMKAQPVKAEIGDNARFFPIARPVVINACCCAA
jgi:hypothetical protein